MQGLRSELISRGIWRRIEEIGRMELAARSECLRLSKGSRDAWQSVGFVQFDV